MKNPSMFTYEEVVVILLDRRSPAPAAQLGGFPVQSKKINWQVLWKDSSHPGSGGGM